MRRVIPAWEWLRPTIFEAPMLKPTQEEIEDLAHQLEILRGDMLRLETTILPESKVHPNHQPSARNLLHYVALRRYDIRDLQQRLASLGLSSLGRTESHVLSAIQAVLRNLYLLVGCEAPVTGESGCDIQQGHHFLERNTDVLLGPPPAGRHVRIMVTMPTETAHDYTLVRDLVQSGMNCMRINCVCSYRLENPLLVD